MISLLFASSLAQISTLNGNQVGGVSDTGSVGIQAPVAPAQVPQTPTASNPSAPRITPVTTPNQAPNLISKVNPIPFPGTIPLPPPSNNCDVNSPSLTSGVQQIQTACVNECSSTCATSVKSFQTLVLDCVALPEVQRKVYVDQLQVKITAQEAYCAGQGVVVSQTTSTAGTTGPSMTANSTSATATMTRRSSALAEGPFLWFVTLLFI